MKFFFFYALGVYHLPVKQRKPQIRKLNLRCPQLFISHYRAQEPVFTFVLKIGSILCVPSDSAA